MLASLLIIVAVAFCGVLLMVGLMWLDVGGDGHRAGAMRQKAARIWQPPYLRGKDLANWARDRATQIVGKWLAGKPTEASPRELAAELHEGATRAMLPSVSKHQTQRTVACPDEGQGMIGVTVPEALEMADYIQRNLPRAKRNRIRDLALENAKKLANLDHTQFSADETPCPLQGSDHVCRVYEARPLRCRPLHIAMIAEQLGLKVSSVAGETPPWAPHEQSVERGIEEGVAESLESAGLDANIYELNSALVTAVGHAPCRAALDAGRRHVCPMHTLPVA